MRNELNLSGKILALLIIATMSRQVPNDIRYQLGYIMLFYVVAFLLFSNDRQKIPVNITLLFKDKKPPDDDKDLTRNLTFEI